MCLLRLEDIKAFLRTLHARDVLHDQKRSSVLEYALPHLHADSHAPKILVRRGKGAKLGPDTARSAVC